MTWTAKQIPPTAAGQAPQAQPQTQFRTTVFTRAPGDERTETGVGPDAQQNIVRASYQVSKRNDINEDDAANIQIRTEPPGPERLFDTRKSEAMMQEYIRRDSTARSGSSRVVFPEYPPLSTEPYAPRALATSVVKVEPSYVCHRRLYFEQPNFERVGWDLGPITTGVSLGVFYYDVFMLPYHSWTNPCCTYECNVGKCLPGDRTPLLLYREPFSVSGLVGQSLAVGTGLFVFP